MSEGKSYNTVPLPKPFKKAQPLSLTSEASCANVLDVKVLVVGHVDGVDNNELANEL